MGLLDRDYYQDHLKKIEQDVEQRPDTVSRIGNRVVKIDAPRSQREKNREQMRNDWSKRTSFEKFIIYCCWSFLIFIAYKKYIAPKFSAPPVEQVVYQPVPPPIIVQPESPKIIQTNPSNVVEIPGGVIINRSRDGTYRTTIHINGVPTLAVIDTGASVLSVPLDFARYLNLPIGQPTQTITANGKAMAYMTHINNLKIGTALIRNVNGHVLTNSRDVLVGMNVIKNFNLMTENDQLKLVMKNADSIAEPEVSRPEPKQITDSQAVATKRPSAGTWKKESKCDKKGECVTSYSQF